MSENELEKSRFRKVDLLSKFQRMPRKIVEINYDNDLNVILKDYPEKVVVIDFWANWCIPCKSYTLIFEKAFQEYSNDFVFMKINVDDTPHIAQYFGITSVPTTALIKEGKILRKFVGVVDYEVLIQILDRFK
ncbi:MAG: thioredoxin family protein [Promethearchaeota archaeon]